MSILLSLLIAASTADADAQAALALAKAQRDRPATVQVAITPAQAAAKQAKLATHSHRCPFDGTIWSHADDSFGKIGDHQCPQCGRVQWQVYQRFR